MSDIAKDDLVEYNSSTGLVTISKKKFLQLSESSRTLDKLYAAGVDNWEGYEEAFSIDSYDDEDENYEFEIDYDKAELVGPESER